MELTTRKEWGARAPRCRTAIALAHVRGLAVHYSGSAVDHGSDARATMRAHQRFHQVTRGWCDVAYSFEVSMVSGEILEGRGWKLRSAANGTNAGNGAYLAVCFQGADKIGRRDVSTEAVEAFSRLVREFRYLTGRWPEVVPHSRFVSTSCPGDELRNMIELEPWLVSVSWPRPLPSWWWRWNAWRLGEGTFKKYGPRAAAARRLTGAPRVISPWAWARARAFDKARKEL